jgi:hypothetical protein
MIHVIHELGQSEVLNASEKSFVQNLGQRNLYSGPDMESELDPG